MKSSDNNGTSHLQSVTHRTPADGDNFAELGFEADEAATLLAETDATISVRQAIMDQLMTELAGWIEASMLDRREAATILGVTPAVVSDLIHRRGGTLTVDLLVDLLFRTGKRVTVSVK